MKKQTNIDNSIKIVIKKRGLIFYIFLKNFQKLCLTTKLAGLVMEKKIQYIKILISFT